MDREERVNWVYASKDNQELAERYNQWAADYDEDLDDGFGWVGPKLATDVFVRHVPKEAKVLDAGAGTGLVGRLLSDEGYGYLVAIDLSQGMLEESRKKNVYRELHQMVLGEELNFPTASFDAVVSVGVLTLGHAPANSLDELVRITKPGGHIVFSIRPDVYRENGFKEKQEELEKQGKWKLTEVTDEIQCLPKGEPDVFHQVFVYRVAA